MAFTRETFVIYDEEYQTGVVEEIQRASVDLNQAAGGSMAMSTQNMRGEFMKETFFKDIEGIVRDRNPNDLSDSVADDITQGEEVSVKIHKSIHVEKALNAFNALGDDARSMSFVVGSIQGKRMAVDYLDTAIASVSAAIQSTADVVYDATAVVGKETISPVNLNRAKKRMGDQSQRIVAWVMDSTMHHDLVEEHIESKITNVADVAVSSGTSFSLGLPVIITDSPFLLVEGEEGAPDTHIVLGLTQAAVQAIESEDRLVHSEIKSGKKNLIGLIQSEYAFTTKVKGCAYTGAQHPTRSDLADSANWEYVVSDVKSGPGIVAKFFAIDDAE